MLPIIAPLCRAAGRGSNLGDEIEKMDTDFLTKETIVRGEIVTVHSLDDVRWFSSRTDARQCKKQREKFWRESKRSIKRSAIFAHESRHGPANA
jgi:hypothetical protein